MILTKRIADAIVKETSTRINKNINIMDTQGKIISSQERSRIGNIHNGAISVIKNKKKLIITPSMAPKWKGANPGINLPIFLKKDIVGVVGVGMTGDFKNMENIGELVKMTTELMVEQSFLFSKTEYNRQIRTMIIEELINKSFDSTNVNYYFNLLNLNPKPPFRIFTINIKERDFQHTFLIQQLEASINRGQLIVSFTNTKRLVIFLHNFEKSQSDNLIYQIYQLLNESIIRFRMSYSPIFYNLNHFQKCYKECNIALKISEPSKKLIPFSEIETKYLLSQINEEDAYQFCQRVINNLNTMETKTLRMFLHNDINIQKTADVLFIHRNTMIYRLKKIIEKTNYDPRNFQEALTLQIALWLTEKNNLFSFNI